MSGPIANSWNGAALPAGTEITTDNVNTAGNGSTVTLSGGSTAGGSIIKEGAGFRVVATQGTTIRRLDVPVTGKTILFQIRFKLDVFHSENSSLIAVRHATAAAKTVIVTPAGRIGFGSLPNTTTAPAIAIGDKVLIDGFVGQAATPTATNGRAVIRVRNLTNPTWNETGEFFYDSGYTLDNGTTDFVQVRSGKQGTDILNSPGNLFEHFGWQTITLNPSDLSEAQAKAYLADAPVDPAPVVPPTSGDAVPIAGPGTGTGWTVYGGAASAGHALADSSTATGIESPDATSTANEYILPLQKMTPRAGLTLTFPGTSLTVAGAAVTVRLYSNGTLVASKPLSVTTTSGSPAVSFSSTEVASVDWEKLSFGLRVVLS